MRQLQKKIKNGTLNIKQDDPFELFVAATNIRYCYYNETHKILGNTFGMCVLQVGSLGLESEHEHSPREQLGPKEDGSPTTSPAHGQWDTWPLSKADLITHSI